VRFPQSTAASPTHHKQTYKKVRNRANDERVQPGNTDRHKQTLTNNAMTQHQRHSNNKQGTHYSNKHTAQTWPHHACKRVTPHQPPHTKHEQKTHTPTHGHTHGKTRAKHLAGNRLAKQEHSKRAHPNKELWDRANPQNVRNDSRHPTSSHNLRVQLAHT